MLKIVDENNWLMFDLIQAESTTNLRLCLKKHYLK
jgi:hypothetical protein